MVQAWARTTQWPLEPRLLGYYAGVGVLPAFAPMPGSHLSDSSSLDEARLLLLIVAMMLSSAGDTGAAGMRSGHAMGRGSNSALLCSSNC